MIHEAVGPVRTPRERRAAQWRRVVSGVAVDARRLRRGAVMSGVRRCERRRALISGVDGVHGLDGRVHLDGTARAVVRVRLWRCRCVRDARRVD